MGIIARHFGRYYTKLLATTRVANTLAKYPGVSSFHVKKSSSFLYACDAATALHTSSSPGSILPLTNLLKQ